MFIQGRRKLMVASVLAAMLASAGSAAMASAAGYGGADDAEEDGVAVKRAACGFIGCGGGNRLCGSAGGTIKAGIPPFVGEVSVTYSCYEAAAF